MSDISRKTLATLCGELEELRSQLADLKEAVSIEVCRTDRNRQLEQAEDKLEEAELRIYSAIDSLQDAINGAE